MKRFSLIVVAAVVACNGAIGASEFEKNQLAMVRGLNARLDKGETFAPTDSVVGVAWATCGEHPIADCVPLMERTRPAAAGWQVTLNRALAATAGKTKIEPWRSRMFQLACEHNAALVSKRNDEEAGRRKDGQALAATCAAVLPSLSR